MASVVRAVWDVCARRPNAPFEEVRFVRLSLVVCRAL
jgi:hypothetical protein